MLTLPEGAYKITGYFSLIIKANVGGMSCAVFWGDGAITRTSTDTIVDPDHTIPSLDELLTKIAAVDDAIARADAAAEEARQAAQSANFTVLDHYDTLDLLKAAHPTGKPGDAYAIGMEEPYDVHIWGVDVQDWVNIGQLQGAQGLPGEQGPAGANGVSPTISIEAIDGGNRVTITDANGPKVFNVMDGKDGSPGTNGSDAQAIVYTINGKNADSNGNFELNASSVGARPDTWMPTAAQVGALPSTYTAPVSSVNGETGAVTVPVLKLAYLQYDASWSDSQNALQIPTSAFSNPASTTDASKMCFMIQIYGKTCFIGDSFVSGSYLYIRVYNSSWENWGTGERVNIIYQTA